ncbi:MAG: hypothetical protein R2751_15265 [Bacteroidales bacterium]
MKMAYRVAVVSGVFCAMVALMLIMNFWNMKRSEPLESKAMELLVERVKQEPNNEELKQEIRSFDLLARKAYFTSKWQVKAGTWLLLAGGILLAVSLKVYTDLRAKIEEPSEITESLLQARANAQYWLFLGGGLVLGLALAASILNNDYLTDYKEGRIVLEDPGAARESANPDVEVIDVFASAGGETSGMDSLSGGGSGMDGQEGAAGTGAVGAGAEGTGSGAGQTRRHRWGRSRPGQTSAGGAQTAAVAFVRDNMKKNQATFRGYMGQGVSERKNIPMQWDGATGDHITWKRIARVHADTFPVIWGDKIFLTGANEASQMVA